LRAAVNCIEVRFGDAVWEGNWRERRKAFGGVGEAGRRGCEKGNVLERIDDGDEALELLDCEGCCGCDCGSGGCSGGLVELLEPLLTMLFFDPCIDVGSCCPC